MSSGDSARGGVLRIPKKRCVHGGRRNPFFKLDSQVAHPALRILLTCFAYRGGKLEAVNSSEDGPSRYTQSNPTSRVNTRVGFACQCAGDYANDSLGRVRVVDSVHLPQTDLGSNSTAKTFRDWNGSSAGCCRRRRWTLCRRITWRVSSATQSWNSWP